MASTPDDGFAGVPSLNRRQGERPAGERMDLEEPRLLLNLPQDFPVLVETDLPLALEWHLHARRLLEHYFARGYRITGFTRVGGPAYLLTK